MRKRPRVFLVFHLFCASLLLFLGLCEIAAPDHQIVGSLFLFFIASCFFDVVLWEVFGKEVLRFSNGEFTIQRKGRLYPRSKTIPCFAIEKISIAKMPLSTLNNFGLLFGTKGGHIRIDYFGNEMDGELSHFYFGENVTYEQANKIIRIMERQKKIYDTLINDKMLNFNEMKDQEKGGNHWCIFLFSAASPEVAFRTCRPCRGWAHGSSYTPDAPLSFRL